MSNDDSKELQRRLDSGAEYLQTASVSGQPIVRQPIIDDIARDLVRASRLLAAEQEKTTKLEEWNRGWQQKCDEAAVIIERFSKDSEAAEARLAAEQERTKRIEGQYRDAMSEAYIKSAKLEAAEARLSLLANENQTLRIRADLDKQLPDLLLAQNEIADLQQRLSILEGYVQHKPDCAWHYCMWPIVSRSPRRVFVQQDYAPSLYLRLRRGAPSVRKKVGK